jgi:hypothetical protein
MLIRVVRVLATQQGIHMAKIDDAFAVLGAYGYTGALEDRLNSYLIAKGDSANTALSDKLAKYGGFNKLIAFLDDSPVGVLTTAAPKVWYDPSDISTMFQDSAGTTPVTALEQPVGKILDKSPAGNHATQAVAGSRPVLSALKNLLLATNTLSTQNVTTAAVPHTLSFTGTGSVTLSGTYVGVLSGGGSLTFTPTAGLLTLTVAGQVLNAQLEGGSNATRYQRVTTSTDYDSVGFPVGLRFDGVDDFLVSNSIDFSTTSAMTVVLGMRKISDAAIGCVAELGPDLSSTPGSWVVLAPAAAAAGSVGYRSKGTLAVNLASPSNYASPIDLCLTGQSVINTNTLSLRVGGTQQASSAANQGGGNYGNLPIYLGRRGGLSFPASMLLYGFTAVGATLSSYQVAQIETYMSSKSGTFL